MSESIHIQKKKNMLVHICCSVDSHYFLSEIQKIYPDTTMIGYFYNPNIHPKSEYDLRLLDVRRSCKMLGVRLVEEEYESQKWFESVKGLEEAPEKGERCVKCFDMRLEKTAQMAHTMSIESFTSTLLSSPLKEQQILFAQGEQIAQHYGLYFIKVDVRSNGGTQAQSQLANKDRLYRQTYCGCQFALSKQRASQGQLPLELMSNIGKQILPASNEQRKAVFDLRDKCEKEGREYALYKQSKIIWRNLRSVCIDEGKVISSYVITHSRSKNMIKTSNITYIKRSVYDKDYIFQCIEVGYAKRDESVFLSIDDVNILLKTQYANVQEMVYNAPYYEDEIALRTALCGADSINPIIILDTKIKHNLKLFINAHFQESSIFAITPY
ncbi:epoxyqueuosine reductase QueH [Helicobacter sp. MIT 21-1697]|uniref:epoxyqueuosine reductase QueH n=1 Tax=Helicobacter sp. MIT 21-1697 TaxID=2993733 RepID=UPI00224B093B|nr:epoxyqueuosine reductase QueH [Helicobacter sp. MIT 21-1697]MCX2717074.1 epoxyqueuosine reductase QueH [Helicobacter sp. MIT 21-1697]